MLTISEDLKELYPAAKLGILIIKNVRNLHSNPKFNEIKASVQNELLNRYPNFNRKEFIKTEPVCFYRNYYKKFKKTYPVQLELESVVLKGKSIPNVSTLVEAMFTAELKNLLLTAGHDFDKINFPLKLSLADGSESFTGISHKEQTLAKNDMMLSDGTSIISSILNGPDYRTKISTDTKNALFYTYIPSGISDDAILSHLKDISNYVSIFSPDAKVDLLKIF
ncbi:phenylalanine--tRNA ligase beta subunit-related protein [Clostridium neuense]|uniref:Phenylalanine--tRNA ligase beta subunit-related protein n=1 Tax=Clostridium neuense TaxID=1728934 RepID=A0ABW8TJ84_9CLOT